MKRLSLMLIGVALILSLILGGCSSSPSTSAPASKAPAPVPASSSAAPVAVGSINLTITIIDARNDARTLNRTIPWPDDLEKATNGKVKFTKYFIADVAKPDEYYDAVLKGRVDMALCAPLINPGRFPLLEVIDIPVPNLPDKYAGRITWDLYQKYPQMQSGFKDVHVVWLHATPPKYLMFNKMVNKLEDMKGLKVAPTGKWGPAVGQALGFTPVTINRDEIAMSLQTGVLQGAMAGWSSVPPGDKGGLSWGQSLPYVVEAPMGIAPYMICMNLDKWNSLPDDVKKAFDNLGGANVVDRLVAADWAVNEAGKKAALEAYKNVQAITLAPAELDRWMKALQPIQSQFAAELDGKGLPGTKIVQDFNALCTQYASKK